MKKSEDISIGRRIRDIRLGKNKFNTKYDQASFAKLIGSTVSALSNWENGRNKPNYNMLKKIADIGEISIDTLVYGQDLDYSSFSELSLSIIEGGVLTDKEKSFLKEHFDEIIPVIYKTVYSAGNSNYLSFYLNDRLVNIAEFKNGDPLLSTFDLMDFDSPYPIIEEDFDTYLKEFSFFKGYTFFDERTSENVIQKKFDEYKNLSKDDKTHLKELLEEQITSLEHFIEIKEILKKYEPLRKKEDKVFLESIKELVNMERDHETELKQARQLLLMIEDSNKE